MLFHFRIRGLSGIIESVVPCSHGQTLNRTVVDPHRHQLRFFLAALEHKGEDQHDCHKHEAEHIAVARTVHEALRGIGTATGRITGLRVKMCVWLGVSRGLDLAFLNAD